MYVKSAVRRFATIDDERLLFKMGDFCARIDCRLFLVDEVLKLFACVLIKVSFSLLNPVPDNKPTPPMPPALAWEGECNSINPEPEANAPLVLLLELLHVTAALFPMPIVVILKVLQLRLAIPIPSTNPPAVLLLPYGVADVGCDVDDE